jgi:hypothetical protein
MIRLSAIVFVGIVVTDALFAAEKSADCQELPIPDLSEFGFQMTGSTRYDQAGLGVGSSYQTVPVGKPGFQRISLYLFDMGLRQIEPSYEKQILDQALRDILGHPNYSNFTFDKPTRIHPILFEKMNGFLREGFYLGVVNPEAPLPEIHMAAVGQYKDCFVKIRFTGYWDGGLDGKDSLLLSLKMFGALSRRIEQQVLGSEWTGPVN